MGVTRLWRGGSIPRSSTEYSLEPSASTAEPTSDPLAAATPSICSRARTISSGRLIRSWRSLGVSWATLVATKSFSKRLSMDGAGRSSLSNMVTWGLILRMLE